MAFTAEFYDYLHEVEKIDGWAFLPKDDPRIVKLQLLAKDLEPTGKYRKSGKRVVVFKEGKFVQAFNSAAEAADELGMRPESVQTICRGERIPPEGLRIEYIKSEVH